MLTCISMYNAIIESIFSATDILSFMMLCLVSSVKCNSRVVTRKCREESFVSQAAFGRCQRMVVVRQSSEWAQVFAGGSKVEEETGRNRPREKGEKGVNFLSVKTPLEREKRRCLLLVILGEKMEGQGRGPCPAQRYPSIRRTVDPPPSSILPPSYILYPREDPPLFTHCRLL